LAALTESLRAKLLVFQYTLLRLADGDAGILAASTVDEPPFILVPYVAENIINHIEKTRAPDLVRLVSHVLLG
jgi:hypothetical protein